MKRAIACLLFLCAAIAAFVLWRDPWLLVRAEYARLRMGAGLSKATVDAAGHRWVYAWRKADTPGAPTLVLVHGFTGSKENWYPLAEQLGGRYRLLIPDLPGWGESQRKPGEDYGYAAQAARVQAFIDALSPDRPVALAGHSMGGGIVAIVAARDAARDAGRIGAVGLVDAAGVPFDGNRFAEQVEASGNPFAVGDEASLQRYLDTVFGDKDYIPRIPWPASTGYIRKRQADAAFEQEVLDRIGRGPERFLPGEEAWRITQPAVLLWCRQDAVIDPSAQAVYAERVMHALSVTLEGCGHMAPMERPESVAQALHMLIGETAE